MGGSLHYGERVRRFLLVVISAAALGVSGVAGATVIAGFDDEPSLPSNAELVAEVMQDATAEPNEQQDADNEGVHGGPIERVHDAAACDLVGLSALPGNWTHGDYVSAVEALGDPELVPIAARSACGMPAHAGGSLDGAGPPDHAGGPPEYAGPPDHAGGPPEHAGPSDHADAPADAGPPESS